MQCEQVEAQINFELYHGHYIVCERPRNIVSALGAIPKDNGKVRLIHDACRTLGRSLNDLTVNNTCTYRPLTTERCHLQFWAKMTFLCFLVQIVQFLLLTKFQN